MRNRSPGSGWISCAQFFFHLSSLFLFSPGRSEADSYFGAEEVFTPLDTRYRLWSRMSNFGIRIHPCWWALTPTKRTGRRGCAVSDSESSHDWGAAKFSELNILLDTWLGRNSSARPDRHLYALALKTLFGVNFSILPGNSSREELNRSETFWAKKYTPYREMTLPAELAAVLSSVVNVDGAWP